MVSSFALAGEPLLSADEAFERQKALVSFFFSKLELKDEA